MGLINRQPSNVQKCSRQPSKTGNFYSQPSNETVIREIKTRVYGKRQTSDSRLRFLNIYNRFTRMVQNNSVYGKHETIYLACFRNGKRSTANEEKWWSRDHFCRLPFAGNASLKLSIVSRQTITRYFKSHYFSWSSRTAGSQRIVLTGTTGFHVPKYA